jgi:uncharacterized protein (DUF302 family)
MRLSSLLLMLLLVCQWPSSLHADGLVMVRTPLTFPEAMLALQESIREHGYTVSRVQRVDVGLTGMGYKTDKYRIVFAGKYDEIRELCDKVPELVAYMPPKISIFAEHGQTILVTAHPSLYASIAGDRVDPVIFDRWESDLLSILHDVRTAE